MKLLTPAIILLLHLVDVATTEYALRHGHTELNPIMGKLMEKQGNLFAYTTKMAGVALLVIYCYRKQIPMHLLAGQSAAPVVNNLLLLLDDLKGKRES